MKILLTSFILLFSFFISSCTDFDRYGNYHVVNPLNFQYDFKSDDFLNNDYKIIKYSELESFAHLNGVYVSDLISDRYFFILDFDKLTYTFVDNQYYIDSYFSNGEDTEINTPEYQHEKSIFSGDIVIKGSVIYFDFLYNQNLVNSEFNIQYYPSLITLNLDYFNVDTDIRSFFIHFYGHRNMNEKIYIKFTKK